MTTSKVEQSLTKTVAQQTVNEISALMAKKKDQLAQLQSKYLTPERLTRVLINCIMRVPKLGECSVASLYRCAISCAELGLEPGGVLGHAYLVPYKNEATLIIGFRGMIELSRRSAVLSDIETHVVHEGDGFDFAFGLQPRLEHRPKLGNKGAPIAAYCVARLKDGGAHVEVMDWQSVMAIRERSRAANDGPWVTDTEEMARKTVLRRTFKYLPTSEILTRAAEIEAEQGDEFEVFAPPPPKAKLSESSMSETISDGVTAPEKVAVGAAATAPAEKAVETKPESKEPLSIEEQMAADEAAKAEAGIAAEVEAKRLKAEADAKLPKSVQMVRALDSTQRAQSEAAAMKHPDHIVIDGLKIAPGGGIYKQWEAEKAAAAAPAEGTAEFADWLIAEIETAGKTKNEILLKQLAVKAAKEGAIPPARKAQVDAVYRSTKQTIK